MTKEKYEDFKIGDQVRSSVGRTVSESDFYLTAGLLGSYTELHTNEEHMKDTQFGSRIAQGPLLILLTLGIAKRSPWEPDAVALYGYDSIRFMNPVFINDTLYVRSEVTEKKEKDDGSGVVTFTRKLLNTDDLIVMTADVHVLVRKADASES